MQYKNKFYVKILSFGFLLFLFSFNVLHGAENRRVFKITSLSGRGCSGQFEPGDLIIRDVFVNNSRFVRLDFSGSTWFAEQGQPNIPCAVFLVGVPQKGKITVSVQPGNFEELSGFDVIPVPYEHKEQEFYSADYIKGEIYNKDRFFPGKVFQSDDPGFIGNLRVIRITVFPVQYNPVKRSLRIYKSLLLKVSWQESESIVKAGAELPANLNKTIVNYKQAKNFIRLRQKSAVVKKSILEGEELFKIPVTETGIYGITGKFLKENNIDISSIDPSNIRLFNNGGKELPVQLSQIRPDSLIEIPVLVTGTEDNSFNESDTIVFFARASSGIEYDNQKGKFTHYLNRFTNKNYYWLSLGGSIKGRRLVYKKTRVQSAPAYSDFTGHFFYEQDRLPMFRGGMTWYNTELSSIYPSQHYTFFAHNPVESQSAVFRLKVKGGTSDNHYINININGTDIGSFTVKGTQIVEKEFTVPAGFKSGENSITVQYAGSGEGAKGYVDWYEIDYRRELKADNGRLIFYSASDPGPFLMNLQGFSSKPLVMAVDAGNDSLIYVNKEASDWVIKDIITDKPVIYAAWEMGSLLEIQSITRVSSSSLRSPNNSADMIIISADDFIQQAEKIANLHSEADNMDVVVVPVSSVFDQFGWGLPDPVAIRDFVRYAYFNWAKVPEYLLLFGGGHFDYRNILTGSKPNKIPPFEYSGSSLQQSRASDDFFAYVSGDDYYPDLAVGRIPAWSLDDAEVVTQKIISYIKNPDFGQWRGLVTFLGDDEKAATGKENETTHLIASEDIAENVLPAGFNKKKIYLPEYPESYSTSRRTRPKAREALIDQINRGTLFFNFIGHGNNKVWTHEWVFHRDIDIPLLDNKDKLPVFYGATCAFARYDDPDEISFAEALLVAEEKGGIASIGASRFCSSIPNEALDRQFIRFLFSDSLSLGQALMSAKYLVSYTSNNELYHLLGDPAMKIGMPQYKARVVSIKPDTFKALSVIHVKGEVIKNSVLWDSFNGDVEVKAFDSKKSVTYKTMYDTKIKYKLSGNAIFTGQGKVKNGVFDVSFVVPKDISYGENEGRLYFYFSDGEKDGSGYKDNIHVGGSSFVDDESGPEIKIYFRNYENFISGDMISGNPELIVEISDDKTGVNITGEIGHKITMNLDDTEQKDLTEFFRYDENSYLSGKIIYSLPGTELGSHFLKIKAWDNANNSSTASAEFKVVESGNIFFEDVLPYPNPFSLSTTFTFKINMDAEIIIKIFTVDGRMIRKIESFWAEPGFNMIEWDGLDSMGDVIANGVYFYKIYAKAVSSDGEITKSYIGKIMKIR